MFTSTMDLHLGTEWRHKAGSFAEGASWSLLGVVGLAYWTKPPVVQWLMSPRYSSARWSAISSGLIGGTLLLIGRSHFKAKMDHQYAGILRSEQEQTPIATEGSNTAKQLTTIWEKLHKKTEVTANDFEPITRAITAIRNWDTSLPVDLGEPTSTPRLHPGYGAAGFILGTGVLAWTLRLTLSIHPRHSSVGLVSTLASLTLFQTLAGEAVDSGELQLQRKERLGKHQLMNIWENSNYAQMTRQNLEILVRRLTDSEQGTVSQLSYKLPGKPLQEAVNTLHNLVANQEELI